MAFAGTTQKCMACEKTVYLVDKLTADNRVYHKACFRCHHCKGTLKVRWALVFVPLFCLWLMKKLEVWNSSCSSVFSSATTIPLKGFFTAGHTLIRSLRGLVVLTKALKVQNSCLNGTDSSGSSGFDANSLSDLFLFRVFRDTQDRKTRETDRWRGNSLFPLSLLPEEFIISFPLISKTHQQKRAASKVANMFDGTRDKCLGCNNTVFPIEKVTTRPEFFFFLLSFR